MMTNVIHEDHDEQPKTKNEKRKTKSEKRKAKTGMTTKIG
jgi:hypothetical protein